MSSIRKTDLRGRLDVVRMLGSLLDTINERHDLSADAAETWHRAARAQTYDLFGHNPALVSAVLAFGDADAAFTAKLKEIADAMEKAIMAEISDIEKMLEEATGGAICIKMVDNTPQAKAKAQAEAQAELEAKIVERRMQEDAALARSVSESLEALFQSKRA